MSTPWMTREEAATYLRVSTSTLDRYVREGKLARHRLAGTRSARFHKEELDALVEPDPEVEPELCGQH